MPDRAFGPLGYGEEVLCEIAEHGAVLQNRDVFIAPEFGHYGFNPVGSWPAVNDFVAAKQCAAGLGTFVCQDDPRPGTCCSQCCHQTGRTGTGDQYVTVCIDVFVAVRVRLLRRLREARGATNDVLVKVPQRLRKHKGLVVETGAEQPRKNVIDCANIEADTRPAFRRTRDQAFPQHNLRRAAIGQCMRAFANLQNGVRFFGTAAYDAARPMQFETAIDQ